MSTRQDLEWRVAAWNAIRNGRHFGHNKKMARLREMEKMS